MYPPLFFSIFVSAVLNHAFNNINDPVGGYLRNRSGDLFNLARFPSKTKVRKFLARKHLFVDDAALVSHSAAGL